MSRTAAPPPPLARQDLDLTLRQVLKETRPTALAGDKPIPMRAVRAALDDLAWRRRGWGDGKAKDK